MEKQPDEIHRSKNRFNSYIPLSVVFIGICLLIYVVLFSKSSNEGDDSIVFWIAISIAIPLLFLITMKVIFFNPSFIIITKKMIFFPDTLFRRASGFGGRWIKYNEIEKVYKFSKDPREKIGILIKGEHGYPLALSVKSIEILENEARQNNIPIDEKDTASNSFTKINWFNR